MGCRARLRSPHLIDEVCIALASQAVQVLAVAIVSLQDLHHIGLIVGVLRDQVQDLLDVAL